MSTLRRLATRVLLVAGPAALLILETAGGKLPSRAGLGWPRRPPECFSNALQG